MLAESMVPEPTTSPNPVVCTSLRPYTRVSLPLLVPLTQPMKEWTVRFLPPPLMTKMFDRSRCIGSMIRTKR